MTTSLSGTTASSGIILRPALVWRAWSLGFEFRLEHAGAQILEAAGVRPIDDNAAIAELSTLQGPLVSHVGRYPLSPLCPPYRRDGPRSASAAAGRHGSTRP
jgi:hypothetical protein